MTHLASSSLRLLGFAASLAIVTTASLAVMGAMAYGVITVMSNMPEIGYRLSLAGVELDRKVGEAIDIYVNNRLVARGEVVLVEEKLGVTMTEVIKSEQN